MTGATKGATQALDLILPSLKKSMPQVPESMWLEFRSEVREDEMLQLTYEIWDKHFTHQEVADLIRFYETPTGGSIIHETPAIQQESIVVGQKWGQSNRGPHPGAATGKGIPATAGIAVGGAVHGPRPESDPSHSTVGPPDRHGDRRL